MNSFGKISQLRRYVSFFAMAAVVMCLFLGSCGAKSQVQLTNQAPPPFVESTDFDPAIPSPESIIGHAVAAKAVRYSTLIRYLQTLAGLERSNTYSLWSDT